MKRFFTVYEFELLSYLKNKLKKLLIILLWFLVMISLHIDN